MATTTFNVRMDEGVKMQVDEVAGLLGLSTAAVFNVFARKFIEARGFPFDVRVGTPTEEEFAAEMDRRYDEVMAGMGSVHELIGD